MSKRGIGSFRIHQPLQARSGFAARPTVWNGPLTPTTHSLFHSLKDTNNGLVSTSAVRNRARDRHHRHSGRNRPRASPQDSSRNPSCKCERRGNHRGGGRCRPEAAAGPAAGPHDGPNPASASRSSHDDDRRPAARQLCATTARRWTSRDQQTIRRSGGRPEGSEKDSRRLPAGNEYDRVPRCVATCSCCCSSIATSRNTPPTRT